MKKLLLIALLITALTGCKEKTMNNELKPFDVQKEFADNGFAFCLGKTKHAVGTEYWLWISVFAVLYVVSAVLLAKATQTIPIGIAYPVWTGIGAVGAVLLGIFVFHEPATFWRVFFLSTLILSIVGLKIIS